MNNAKSMFRWVVDKAIEFARTKKTLMLYISILFIIFLGILQAYLSYNIALTSNTYRSDEIWYVSSARNILREVFHTEVSYKLDGQEIYTVFAYNQETILKIRSIVVSSGGIIVKEDYSNTLAIAVGISDPVVLEEINKLDGIRKIIKGFPYPDARDIDSYLNFEHPPLGKYIIGLSMKLCSDTPMCWRIPSIISSSLIVISVGLVALKIFGPIGGILASLIGLIDPLSTNLGSVAMLDIFLAAFTALGLLMISRNKYLLATILFTLAFNVKYSGLFLIIGIYIFLRLKQKEISKITFLVFLPFIIVTFLVYLPYIYTFGLERIIAELASALRWHTMSRPEGPISSNPLHWILGLKSFYISVNPDIPARGHPWIYIPAFVSLILLLPSLSRLHRYPQNDNLKITSILSLLFFVEYMIIMILGNRTLYSFYFVNFSPLGYLLFVKFIDMTLLKPHEIDESLALYKQWFLLSMQGDFSWLGIPREIKIFIPSVMFNKKYRNTLLVILIIIVVSLFLHCNFGTRYGLYSDTLYIVEEAPISEPGRLMGVQGLIIATLHKLKISPNILVIVDLFFLYLLINEVFLLTRKIEDRLSIRTIFRVYPMILTLLFFSGYDGSIISLFFFFLAINLILENKTETGFLTLALSSGNPMMFLVNTIIALLYSARLILVYISVVISLMLIIPLVLNAPLYQYILSVSSFYITQKTATFYSIIGIESIYFVATIITFLFAWFLVNKYDKLDLITRITLILLVFTVIYPNMLPQWGVFLLLIPIVLPKGFLGRILLVDLANALIIITWFINQPLMQSLFKYSSTSPLDFYSLPTMMYIVRSLTAFSIMFTLCYQKIAKINKR